MTDVPRSPAEGRSVLSAATVLGIGMGAFVDGIVFHQILQVHSMLSARIDRRSIVNLEINMFWDGIFHLFAWLTTLLGIALLWRALSRATAPWATGTLVGGMLFGWGAFNVVEGVIDHQLLAMHHVVEDVTPHIAPDLAFLGFGAALIIVGWRMAARAAQA